MRETYLKAIADRSKDIASPPPTSQKEPLKKESIWESFFDDKPASVQAPSALVAKETSVSLPVTVPPTKVEWVRKAKAEGLTGTTTPSPLGPASPSPPVVDPSRSDDAIPVMVPASGGFSVVASPPVAVCSSKEERTRKERAEASAEANSQSPSESVDSPPAAVSSSKGGKSFDVLDVAVPHDRYI